MSSADLVAARRVARAPSDSAWLALLRRRDFLIAAGVLGLLVLIAAFAPVLAPHDPLDQDLLRRLEPPQASHLLGTDESGRDVLSRLMYGTRISLLAALLAVGVAVCLGVPAGLFAGYVGRWPDFLLSRVADATLSIPGLVLAIAITAVLGPSLRNAMIAVGLVYAPGFFRVARAATIAVRGETYIAAARVNGCSTWRVVTRHVLPNVSSALLVKTFLTLGYAILAEAALSFIGLGVQPPEASWGVMLQRSIRYLDQAPLLVVFPGVAILIAVLSLNVVGDAVRDVVARVGREVV